MSDAYDPLEHEEDGPDEEVEDEDGDEAQGEEGDGDSDEESEEASGAADGDGEEASGTSERPVRQPSRAERRVQQALETARKANERAERAERLVAEATRRPAQPQETAAQRAERLAMMDPEERVNFLLQEQGQQFRSELEAIRFQTADSADRTAFEGLCARNPVASKLKSQVEDYLAQMRSGGTNAPRETVLRYVIGDRALANAGKATGKARRAADDNRTRQTARPASARSDTAGEGRRATSEQEARRRRLEDVQI